MGELTQRPGLTALAQPTTPWFAGFAAVAFSVAIQISYPGPSRGGLATQEAGQRKLPAGAGVCQQGPWLTGQRGSMR